MLLEQNLMDLQGKTAMKVTDLGWDVLDHLEQELLEQNLLDL
jgi:hypothetical protein